MHIRADEIGDGRPGDGTVPCAHSTPFTIFRTVIIFYSISYVCSGFATNNDRTYVIRWCFGKYNLHIRTKTIDIIEALRRVKQYVWSTAQGTDSRGIDAIRKKMMFLTNMFRDKRCDCATLTTTNNSTRDEIMIWKLYCMNGGNERRMMSRDDTQ